MTITRLLAWRVPSRWPLQRWLARQSRLMRFLAGLVAFAVTMLVLAALVPGWEPPRIAALVGGAIGFAAMTAWLPRRQD